MNATIERFRAAMNAEGKATYGVIYVQRGVQYYYPRLVIVSEPDEVYDVEGDLVAVCDSTESLGNAAGPASVQVARIAKALGILDAEESEERAGIA